MRRAFVGFSSPIGYSYGIDATKTDNDQSSSPNPVLFGSMGLLTLYDEIWFACESLCPQSMRGLPYVKYLDAHGPGLSLAELDFENQIDRICDNCGFLPQTNLNGLFENGFGDGMTEYLGGQFKTDNHTHGLSFLGVNVGGNPGMRQFAMDMWLIERFKNMKLEIVFNPLTAAGGFDDGSGNGISRVRELGLVDQVLTFGSLYDITGPTGPYHPCVEEIRDDSLLREFRKWMRNSGSHLDNQDIAMVQADVDNKVREFTQRTLRNSVKPQNLAAIAVKLAKNALFDQFSFGGAVSTIAEAIDHNRQANQNGWKAFVALSRNTLFGSEGEHIRRR